MTAAWVSWALSSALALWSIRARGRFHRIYAEVLGDELDYVPNEEKASRGAKDSVDVLTAADNEQKWTGRIAGILFLLGLFFNGFFIISNFSEKGTLEDKQPDSIRIEGEPIPMIQEVSINHL